TFTRTAFGISPTGPLLPRLPAVAQPLLLPAVRYAPHLPDCAQLRCSPAPALPVPPRPRQTDVHIGILWLPAGAATPLLAEVRAASVSATPNAHPPAIRSGGGARRVLGARPGSADHATAERKVRQSPDG